MGRQLGLVVFLAGCASPEGQWVGSTEVEIHDEVLAHDVEVHLVEGRTQEGSRQLEGDGTVVQEGVEYSVRVEGPWRGSRVDAELLPEVNDYAFGVTEYGVNPGGGAVRPDIVFRLEGRARGQELVGRLIVERFGDLWDGRIELERVE